MDANLRDSCRVARWFIFKPKIQIGKILEGLAMEDVVIFYVRLVHFTVFCYILLTLGIVCGKFGIFFPFWYFVPRKIWQPWIHDPPF
jgi:hypothetical protein